MDETQVLASFFVALSLSELLPILLPIVAVSLGLTIFCLVDIFRKDRQVKGGNKLVWALIVILGNTLGQIVYLVVGREDM